MKKILNITSTIISTLLAIIILVFTIVSVYSYLKNKPIEIFGKSYGVVETNSMHPKIIPGDFVFIEKIDYDKIKIGDVIAFESVLNITIIHEVIDISNSGITTKGINNITDDLDKEGYITEDRVIGIVTWYGLNQIGKYLVGDRTGLISIIIILIGILFTLQLIEVVKDIKEKQKNKLELELKEYEEKLKKELEDKE